jgi:transcriptional regulator with XRE-family HTH domain
MKTFSEKLKEARSAVLMSQDDLSKQIGVSRRSVLAYEKGEKHPRDGVLYKIARVLNVSVKYLKDDTCENPREDIEKDSYIAGVAESFGAKGARDMTALLADNQALFAGGDFSQEEKDAYFEALMTAYVTCKENAKKKYGRSKKD